MSLKKSAFQKNKYSVLKGAINKELADFVFAYFLKASEATSMPLFEDPRPGNTMNLLPEADKSKVTYASSQINYKVTPGKTMFFPSYMPHQYIIDMGYEPFRFIHWNCQAIPKVALNAK